MEIVGRVRVTRVVHLSRLVAMFSCLDESMSYSGMGPNGGFMNDIASIVCHLMSIGVARGSYVEEPCVIFCRYSGDSACRILWK